MNTAAVVGASGLLARAVSGERHDKWFCGAFLRGVWVQGPRGVRLLRPLLHLLRRAASRIGKAVDRQLILPRFRILSTSRAVHSDLPERSFCSCHSIFIRKVTYLFAACRIPFNVAHWRLSRKPHSRDCLLHSNLSVEYIRCGLRVYCRRKLKL